MVDLAYQAAQYRSWPYLNIRCDALGRRPADDRVPPDWRRHLRDERLDRADGVALRFSIDVGNDRDPRGAGSKRPQLRSETVLRRLHQRAMERGADMQRDDALRALCL